MKDHHTPAPDDAEILAEIRRELAKAMAAKAWEADERARYGFTLAEYAEALEAEIEAELDAIRARYAEAEAEAIAAGRTISVTPTK